MKAPKTDHLSVRIVGRRHHWNWQFRFTRKQWRAGLAILAGVLPLTMAFGVYVLLGHIFTPPNGQARLAQASIAAHREVVALTGKTAAGLDIMAYELGALNVDATRLSVVQSKLIRQAGIHPAAFHERPRAYALPAADIHKAHLIAKLHALARRFANARAGRAL